MRVVLATSNRGKQRELAALLAPLGLTLELSADLGIASPEETGTSFEANALLKARHASRLAVLPALADDSGLAVDALDGGPGIYSARYAGLNSDDAANNARLLAELAVRPASQRSARYCCVLALVRHADDPAPLLARGSWEGHIALERAGEGGFGYDPLFIPQGYGQTVAELPALLKQQHSHRALAAARLVAQLRAGALGGAG